MNIPKKAQKINRQVYSVVDAPSSNSVSIADDVEINYCIKDSVLWPLWRMY